MCEKCDFDMRVQHNARPKHFSESRVHFPKEQYDKKLLSNMIFPLPPVDDEPGDNEPNDS